MFSSPFQPDCPRSDAVQGIGIELVFCGADGAERSVRVASLAQMLAPLRRFGLWRFGLRRGFSGANAAS